MKKKVVILGGQGDGLVIAETIKRRNDLELLGFLNDDVEKTPSINNIPVLGKLKDWLHLTNGVYFIQALNTLHRAQKRFELITSLSIPDHRWINIIDPLSAVAENTDLGYGVYIGSFVTIQPNVKLGNHISIRAAANLGHDVQVGDFCYVGPGAVLCGRTKLQNGVHIGPNACIIDRVVAADYTILGACSVLTKNSKTTQKLFGVPAREIHARN